MLWAIQYTPRAAGREKPIHRENRGIISSMLLLAAAAELLAWPFMLIFITRSCMAAEMMGISKRPTAPQVMPSLSIPKLLVGMELRSTPKKV